MDKETVHTNEGHFSRVSGLQLKRSLIGGKGELIMSFS